MLRAHCTHSRIKWIASVMLCSWTYTRSASVIQLVGGAWEIHWWYDIYFPFDFFSVLLYLSFHFLISFFLCFALFKIIKFRLFYRAKLNFIHSPNEIFKRISNRLIVRVLVLVLCMCTSTFVSNLYYIYALSYMCRACLNVNATCAARVPPNKARPKWNRSAKAKQNKTKKNNAHSESEQE